MKQKPENVPLQTKVKYLTHSEIFMIKTEQIRALPMH